MSDDKTEAYLVERYGPPIYRTKLEGYTWEEREDGSIPVEVMVFSLPKSKGGCIVWGRWRDDTGGAAVWGGNWGERSTLAHLIKESLTPKLQDIDRAIAHILTPVRPDDWKPGKRDIFSDAFVELRWCWNQIEQLKKSPQREQIGWWNGTSFMPITEENKDLGMAGWVPAFRDLLSIEVPV